ncbi:Regulation of nuclear pre-mRNA domain-containing protein 1B [Ananas comosus]|uniref:Regulation of nuclear pre-mRNA domain-containing protein 1B n=1 Tax=Ananas comosus TaxID=4615 RepID=A0A199V5X2_ANACO|nr:Regulation of nuclear pre-mRNA domain-containing protein 1B [Ananas comosus]
MNSVFSEQILADKLSKLNSTQQCIETLSHWCIFHRKNAEQVVKTWDKQFHSSEKERKIPYLYLANDILQNSKRNGTEFVGEFWKVLPAALKDVVDNGDDHGKNVVSRLVNIWEERRVFGSRARGLNDLMLGNEPLPTLELNKKRSRSSVKIVRKDSRSIRTKLSIGGTPEKIVSAFHTVQNEHTNEAVDLDKCKAAVRRVEKMAKDVDTACSQVGDPRRETLANELQEEEAVLKQCLEKLKVVEANRASLVSQLKEALHEQLAQGMIGETANMRRRLNNEPTVTSTKTPSSSEAAKQHANGPSSVDRPSKKKAALATAAEVADRLAASMHSQQIMTSVLSSFAAEEAKNASLAPSTNSSNSVPDAPSESKTKIQEKTLQLSNSASTSFVPVQPVVVSSTLHQPQSQFNLFPSPAQQFMQQPGGVLIGMPYTYNTLTLPPPPPPLPPPGMMGLARPATLIQQPPVPPPPPQPLGVNQQQMPVTQQLMPMNQHGPQFSALQQPAMPSFRPLQPPGMGFYHPQIQ